MNSYKEQITVKSYETDHKGNLKPFVFMNHAQEMAGADAIRLGFGFDDLIKNGNVWVLSRVHVKFLRTPEWREVLEMETWHKGADRLFGFRDFRVSDKSGNEIILATSSWLVINYETRRVQRIESILRSDLTDSQNIDAIKEPAARLYSPGDLLLTSKRVVTISDIDINKHTNNARYVEWAMDAIKPEVGFNMSVKEMWINFNNESLAGDEIDLYTSYDPSLFVEGKRGETSIFQLKILNG
jgi:acyl-ACP thioesterase